MIRHAAFDVVIAVDFSSAARPTLGRDSLWVHERRTGEDPGRAWNHATRDSALEVLCDSLTRTLQHGQRVLMVVDFALGYPKGLAQALGIHADDPGERARQTRAWIAEHVVDEPDNRHNRDEVAASLNLRLLEQAWSTGVDVAWGPFWGGSARDLPEAVPRKRLGPLPWPCPVHAPWFGAFRATDRAVRSRIHRPPCSPFQLAYAGAVGGQTLLGIAWLERLRTQLAHPVHLWPFETPPLQGPAVVVAENYPSLLLPPSRVTQGTVDEAQVRTWTQWWCARSPDEQRALLARPSQAADIPWREEGWILGLPIPQSPEPTP